MNQPAVLPTVVFENEEYLILNKPAGWYSIPARVPSPEDHVVTEWLSSYLHSQQVSAWVVHRLDRYTSGIMLFAKTAEAHQLANAWFQNREVKKVYHFFATPIPTRPAIQIKTPVEGKAAQTLFEVIEKKDHYFYGKATPLTGRFHQVREHAQEAGFPILGDIAYGGVKKLQMSSGQTLHFPRFCLHAQQLTLPFGTYQAPLPEDLEHLK